MRVQHCLDALKNADRLVDALRLADELALQASRDSNMRNVRLLRSALGSQDQVVAIAATHALAQMVDKEVDEVLSELLSSQHAFLREHGAWAHRSRVPRAEPIARLIGLVAAGGFAAMLSQRTLEAWAAKTPELVCIGVESALLGFVEPESRYRLVETLGLVRDSMATSPLLRLAQDTTEKPSVRVAAIAALGQRNGEPNVVDALKGIAGGTGELADVARLSLLDLGMDVLGQGNGARGGGSEGLTVAQLFLHADIDSELSNSGSGDNGGIATLLVGLGDALVAEKPHGPEPETHAAGCHGSVERVLTLSRGNVGHAVEDLATLGSVKSGHLYGHIPLLQGPKSPTSAWHLLVAARRGINRILRMAGNVQVFHLRMADVGSLAAYDVAESLEIPVVFTVAPDPHAIINSMDLAGTLTRENFGSIDEIEHFWFRARFVQRLAANSAHNVFFPRPHLRQDILNLIGIDMAEAPEHHTVVPEGIDQDVIDQALQEAQFAASGSPATAALLELAGLLEQLPEERRGLPLLTSVGRFHRVKGMAAVVEAWATSDLHQRTNLLLIGGNLQHPSMDEQEQLRLINGIVAPADHLRKGLLMPGHRPNGTVARWVAATRTGLPGLAAPLGVYVCGSLKEEFGIALLEAMAAGLVVVGPSGGGPATYVEEGHTGFLTATWDAQLLAGAINAALARAASPDTAERAAYSRNVVRERFTIEAMARNLTRVYAQVHQDDVLLRRELIALP